MATASVLNFTWTASRNMNDELLPLMSPDVSRNHPVILAKIYPTVYLYLDSTRVKGEESRL